jgi:gamma-glutamyltranspeptidase/glutathione hydrolase
MGVMGGFMQPQGHVQVISALLDDGCDPQSALDRLRFCINPDGSVALEEGLPEETIETLAAMRHTVNLCQGHDRKLFGRGQIILRTGEGFYAAGSDPRADGCAFGI